MSFQNEGFDYVMALVDEFYQRFQVYIHTSAVKVIAQVLFLFFVHRFTTKILQSLHIGRLPSLHHALLQGAIALYLLNPTLLLSYQPLGGIAAAFSAFFWPGIRIQQQVVGLFNAAIALPRLGYTMAFKKHTNQEQLRFLLLTVSSDLLLGCFLLQCTRDTWSSIQPWLLLLQGKLDTSKADKWDVMKFTLDMGHHSTRDGIVLLLNAFSSEFPGIIQKLCVDQAWFFLSDRNVLTADIGEKLLMFGLLMLIYFKHAHAAYLSLLSLVVLVASKCGEWDYCRLAVIIGICLTQLIKLHFYSNGDDEEYASVHLETEPVLPVSHDADELRLPTVVPSIEAPAAAASIRRARRRAA